MGTNITGATPWPGQEHSAVPAADDDPLAQQAFRSDQELVDRITYLASLASEFSVVDPMLDPLRSITARQQADAPLTSEDRAALVGLEARLTNYLLNDDPLRSFTPQSLAARLDTRKTVQAVRPRSMLTVFGLSLLAALLAFLFSPATLPWLSRGLLTVPFFFLTLHLGIAWFYLSALRGFKPEFRRAFTFIAVGVLLFSVHYSQYALIVIFNLERFSIFHYGGITWIITICFVWLYAGLRLYARQLSIGTIFASWRVALAAAVCVTAAAFVTPHGGNPHELFFDISLASIWLFDVFIILCIGLTHKIIKNVTATYARPMKALNVYFVIALLAALGSSTLLPILGELKGELLSVVSAVLGIGPQTLLLYTGYLFKKETSR